MAHLTKDKTAINARIVFWGIAGAGVTTNLTVIRDKLRADHRGELRSLPTALDPTTHYEVLPIELGQVNGLRTQLQVVGLPGGTENAATRKQLLDHVDGVVLIIDAQPTLLEDNLHSVAELRDSLAAYGRSLDELPVVVQYNKRDLSDPYTIEDLHRRLSLASAAVFEGVATQGTGVLQTLTTISKRVVRVLRDSDYEALPPAPELDDPALAPEVEAEALPPEPELEEESLSSGDDGTAGQTVDLMEEAILADGSDPDDSIDEIASSAESLLDAPSDGAWEAVAEEMKNVDGARIGADFELVSVGTATRQSQRAVRVPLVLGNPAGETVTLALTIQLDPLLDGEPE